LAVVGHAELKQSGAFLLPGFAKFQITEKPATPAHEGVNPFTKEPMTFKAKPTGKGAQGRVQRERLRCPASIRRSSR
jgi:hypothetical protein